ncbi:MAG TPA: class I SAM-dependent methyltransferase [Burkholderiales bacterium]|nr:class I SAM-dependent methyltransferase [Burkholderiales bacterium]
MQRVLLTMVLSASLALAGEPPVLYSSVTRSEDGIGKAYMGREIAKVMTYHGAPWLERVGRTKEERPDLVLAAFELKQGMAVADVGAGSGYYSRRMAQLVGKSGTVYAVDIQPRMLKLIERDLARHTLANVKTVLATAKDPNLRAGSLDLAVMVDVYHELEFPYEVMRAVIGALKPGGRLALVEFRAGDPNVPIKRLHTMTEEQVRQEMAVHAVEWVNTVRDLPWQHVIVFRKTP